jgi:ubiquinone/menaquinone biosynthesis C-methylase UbiE
VGNAADLPWPDASFDIVSQFTTFTSILAASDRERAAEEVHRVLRPDGTLVWYDFWVNPTNKNTRPISAAGVRRLFPGFVGTIRRLTLAPPIARRIAPRSLLLASLLQELSPFQTHLLGVLKKSG